MRRIDVVSSVYRGCVAGVDLSCNARLRSLIRLQARDLVFGRILAWCPGCRDPLVGKGRDVSSAEQIGHWSDGNVSISDIMGRDLVR